MTNEELKQLQGHIDDISIEMDVIMHKIQDHNTEINALWHRYWKLFGELTDEITMGDKG